MALLAAFVAAFIWVAFWGIIIATTGVPGLLVAGVIHAFILFAYCFWYAVFNL